MKVRYDGSTIDTQFGKVMFDADRLLKCLDMGYDNVTHQEVSSSVPGYQIFIFLMMAILLGLDKGLRRRRERVVLS